MIQMNIHEVTMTSNSAMHIHEVTMTSYLQCIFMIQMNIHAVNVT